MVDKPLLLGLDREARDVRMSVVHLTNDSNHQPEFQGNTITERYGSVEER